MHPIRFLHPSSFGWVLSLRSNSKFSCGNVGFIDYLTRLIRHSLLSKTSGKAQSDGQKATLLENRAALLHHIEQWRKVQAVYMPGVLDTTPTEPVSPARVKAESVKLWLPSQLDAEDRVVICLGGVVNSEKELRLAHLEDSLSDLRRARRTRLGLITFHKVQLTGQGQKTQTKSQAAMKSIQDRIDRHVRRYRTARDALLLLDPQGSWTELYLPLTDNDNRGPMKELEEVSSSDGQYAPSWIWRSNTTAVSREEVNKDMRVEWAQCVARAERWEEETTLLQEEMRRVVQFLEWRSGDWLAKLDSRVDTVAPAVHSGLSAYAKKQGAIFHNLAVRFCQRWRLALISLSLPHEWATQFLETHKEQLVDPDKLKKKKKRRTKIPYVAHLRNNPLAPVTAIEPLPTTLESIDHKPQFSDVDSDGTSSEEDDESGYESSGSFSD